MKANATVFALAMAAIVVAGQANAQQTSREEAVSDCIAQAQQRIAASGNPNDPQYNNRYNVYASCMREKGQNP